MDAIRRLAEDYRSCWEGVIRSELPLSSLNVRHQGFLDRLRLRLREYLAHLFVDVMRPAFGIASAVC